MLRLFVLVVLGGGRVVFVVMMVDALACAFVVGVLVWFRVGVVWSYGLRVVGRIGVIEWFWGDWRFVLSCVLVCIGCVLLV